MIKKYTGCYWKTQEFVIQNIRVRETSLLRKRDASVEL